MAMCARKDLWEALKKKRAAIRKETDDFSFETLRGKTERDMEKDERRVIARQRPSRRLEETERGMIITR